MLRTKDPLRQIVSDIYMMDNRFTVAKWLDPIKNRRDGFYKDEEEFRNLIAKYIRRGLYNSPFRNETKISRHLQEWRLFQVGVLFVGIFGGSGMLV